MSIIILLALLLSSSLQAASITGSVVDPSGLPVPGVRIVAKSTDSSATAYTNGSGRYVIPDLPQGRYVIEASLSGYQTETHTIEVKTGEVTVWEVRFAVLTQLEAQLPVEHFIEWFFGSDLVNCGRHDRTAGIREVAASKDCGMRAIQAKQPFLVIISMTGINSYLSRGLAAGSDGDVYEFSYDGPYGSSPCEQCQAMFSVRRCPSPDVVLLYGFIRFRCGNVVGSPP